MLAFSSYIFAAIMCCAGVWSTPPEGGKWVTSRPGEDAANAAHVTLETPGWRCDCWRGAEKDREKFLDCRCAGLDLTDIPLDLQLKNVQSLTLSKTGMRILKSDTLLPFQDSLRDLTLMDMKFLKRIEKGSFSNLKHLRSIYITEAPELRALPLGIFHGLPKSFTSLRILRTGVEILPDVEGIGQETIVHMIDVESNNIRRVKSNSMSVKAEQVILNYNLIESVDGWAFNGSEIGKLSFKGNGKLTRLSHDAFLGLHSLRELDLSETSITHLPTGGLYDLDVLRITDTRSLKVIPSVYSFRDLREAWLTYSFHCCAFKFPARHDPRRHILHEEYLSKIQEMCKNDLLDDTGQRPAPLRRKRWTNDVKRPADFEDTETSMGSVYQYDDDRGFGAIGTGSFDVEVRDQEVDGGDDSRSSEENSAESKELNRWVSEIGVSNEHGFFHQTTATVSPLKLHALCGNLTRRAPHVQCTPSPDALNPCEDIMGYNWLRVCVWFVVITAMFGNLAVLVVLLSTMFDVTVPKFLMCHLAFADLCMGAYLLILASMDLHSSGFYFNYAFDWQIGSGCKVAGFLTVFASQLSIFTLTILTLERWFAITYAIYLNRRLKLRRAAQIMACGWFYSLAMAALPLFDISSYSTTSICLPMDTQDTEDVAYLICLLVINGLAFVVICICYGQIYMSLGKETRACAMHGEMTVAKKMALLVFTDFACWAPIAFFGLTAVAGYPLIDVTNSKILLVFFYPLNSCANPYLYAILTAQYRKDLFTLLSRYGLFTRKAQQYKMTYSLPTTNSPYPLLPRVTPGSFSIVSNGNSRAQGEEDEAMV